MRRLMYGVIGLVVAGLVAAACGKSTPTGSGGSPSAHLPAVTVGSNNFAESDILAEMYGQVLAHAGYPVNYKLDVGARQVLQAAMPSQIQVAPEYVGSLLSVYLGGTGSSDPAAEFAEDNTRLAPKKLTLVAYSPAADQNAFVVTKATADKYHLVNVSDLKNVTTKLTLGGPPECPTSPLCLQGLQNVYGLSLNFQPIGVCDSATAQALQQGRVDIAELCSTQSVIAQNGWVVLNDDKHLEQADNITAEVSTALLSAHPDIKTLLTGVTSKLTTGQLVTLDADVEISHQDASTVARTWLSTNGLL
jgi:osmoprotectant transport system substrate-binding protein